MSIRRLICPTLLVAAVCIGGELAASAQTAQPATQASGQPNLTTAQALQSGDRATVEAALRSLRDDPRFAAEVLPDIEALVRADQPEVTVQLACEVLARYRGGTRPGEFLRRIARTDETPAMLRQSAIAALVHRPERMTLETLVRVQTESPAALSTLAGRTLVQLTQQAIAPDDRAGWAAWWQRVSVLPADELSRDIAAAQSTLAGNRRLINDDARRAVRLLMQDQLRQTDEAGRSGLLETWLQSPMQSVRLFATRMALDEFRAGNRPTDAIRQLIRQRLSDESPDVRQRAAETIDALNDADSLEPLLLQAAIETNWDARLAQIQALRPLRSEKSVDVLLPMLTDPSPAIRQRVAATLVDSANESQRQEVARSLVTLYRDVDPASPERTALLEAMAALPQSSLEPIFRELLTAAVRDNRTVTPLQIQLALRGLALSGNDQSSELAVEFLAPQYDAATRIAAVRTIGATAGRSLEIRTQLLEGRLIATREPDSAVRDVVWQTLLTMMPKLSDQQLLLRLSTFQSDPAKQLEVFRILAARAEANGQLPSLANFRDQMAELLLEKLNQPAEAATLYRQALDYELSLNQPSTQLVSTRTRGAYRALLRARQLADAATFASGMMGGQRDLTSEIGPEIKRELARLRQADDTDSALRLIESVLAYDPPLSDRTQRELREQQTLLATQAGEGNDGAS